MSEDLNDGSEPPLMPFMTVFDGSQPEVGVEEKKVVSQRFRDLVADILLNHAEQVKHYGGSVPNDTLTLRVQESASVEWAVYTTMQNDPQPPSDEWESADEIRAELSLTKVIDGWGKGISSYRQGSDGIVRRNDIRSDRFENPDLTSIRSVGFSALSEGEPRNQREQALLALQKTQELGKELRNGYANHKLARSMGYIDQPITLPELEGLEAFLHQPGFEVPPYARNV